MREACPICDGTGTMPFLQRQAVPTFQNLPLASADAARRLPRGQLHFVVCESCGFVFNAAFDPALVEYGEGYENCQSHSPSFGDYVESLVERVIAAAPANAAFQVVEVGCGNGEFLRRLTARNQSCTAWGFDPSYVGPSVQAGGRVRVESCVYDSDASRRVKADVVVCRHVIEHVPEPRVLLETIRTAASAPGTPIFIETPCVAWILRKRVFWDFFYEHCSLFTARSLARALAGAGIEDARVEHTFGEQYLFAEGRAGIVTEIDGDFAVLELAREYRRHEEEDLLRWRAVIARRGADGRVAIWGAGAKGVTLANVLDPLATEIACIVDVNPAKQGKFIPGSGHKIVAPEELSALGVTAAILMNPNYRDEIERWIREARVALTLLEYA
jgi:SAM-dependent methyltransferase